MLLRRQHAPVPAREAQRRPHEGASRGGALGCACARRHCRLHCAPLPVPLSPCLVRCVGSSVCVRSHTEATRTTNRPTVVSAHFGVAAPAPIAAILLAINVSAHARAASIKATDVGATIHQGNGRRARGRVDRDRDRDRLARDRPAGDRLARDQPAGGRPARDRPAHVQTPHTPARGTVRARGTQTGVLLLESCYWSSFIAVTPHIITELWSHTPHHTVCDLTAVILRERLCGLHRSVGSRPKSMTS